MSACPYHAAAPITCEVCGAICEASKGGRCLIVHDADKHDPPEPTEPPALVLSRSYPYEDGRYGA